MAPRSTPLFSKKSRLAGIGGVVPLLLLAAGLFLPACSDQTKEFDAAWKAPSEFITTPPEVSMAGEMGKGRGSRTRMTILTACAGR